MKRLSILAVASLALCGSAAAQAEVYPQAQQIQMQKQLGKGTAQARYAFTRDKATPDQATREIGFLTLQPGDAVGVHKHIDNEDAYIIVSGEGTFTDNDGKTSPVKAGDITIVRKGQSHGLANTGTVPLVFVDVIAQQ
jgi:mannose-6-phosphate isomerase-like protein (cupin superfamily)